MPALTLINLGFVIITTNKWSVLSRTDKFLATFQCWCVSQPNNCGKIIFCLNFTVVATYFH